MSDTRHNSAAGDHRVTEKVRSKKGLFDNTPIESKEARLDSCKLIQVFCRHPAWERLKWPRRHQSNKKKSSCVQNTQVVINFNNDVFNATAVFFKQILFKLL